MDETTEQLINQIADATQTLGVIEGIECSANFLLERAAEYFKEKNDKAASLFRELADGFMADAHHRRKQYEKDKKAKYHSAWETLDKAIGDIKYPVEEEKK